MYGDAPQEPFPSGISGAGPRQALWVPERINYGSNLLCSSLTLFHYFETSLALRIFCKEDSAADRTEESSSLSSGSTWGANFAPSGPILPKAFTAQARTNETLSLSTAATWGANFAPSGPIYPGPPQPWHVPRNRYP